MSIQWSDLYVREAAIPNFGKQGLTKLRTKKIGIAGVGGVGSSAAYFLAKSGIGGITLIDQDIIEPSNLQRIHSATQQDLFHPKAEVVAKTLTALDPSLRIDPVVETITNRNVDQLFEKVDLIFDGVDNFRTRYTLNKYATQTQTPYLFNSAVAEQAHLALFNPPNTPCLECVMPSVPDRFEESCETLGVTPRITALAGVVGADTAIRFLLRAKTRLSTELMTLDLEGPEVIFSRLLKRSNCPVCGVDPTEQATTPSEVSFLCGEHTANILPPKKLSVHISKAAAVIPSDRILLESDSVLVCKRGSFTISLFGNGRILIGGVDEEEKALEVASEIWHLLEESNSFDPAEQ